LSAALEYHRATNYAPQGWEAEDELRYVGPRPALVKEYVGAEKLPLDVSIAGPLLAAGAGVIRSQPGRDYGGGTMHWRVYSSAGALYPVEAYVAAADALYSFDPLSRVLVRVARGDARAAVGAAVDAAAETFVVLTGIHARTGWKYLERGYRHVWWDAGTMLANLLALAGAEELQPRLYVGFVDGELNDLLGVNGIDEYALAVLGLGEYAAVPAARLSDFRKSSVDTKRRYPLAEAAHAAGTLAHVESVKGWRTGRSAEEPKRAKGELTRAIRQRRSIRRYARRPLPREEFEELLAWSEAPVPADVPRAVRQLVAVANVDGLAPGVYGAQLDLVRPHPVRELRERAQFAAWDQAHAGRSAVNVFQMADLDAVVARHGDRGYRWAQLEAGIRAGRLQVGAFINGWGAVASTFLDDEVSRLLETHEAPMLMVAIGPR
jgi:SagB-type dehydrogenase family enzyme